MFRMTKEEVEFELRIVRLTVGESKTQKILTLRYEGIGSKQD